MSSALSTWMPAERLPLPPSPFFPRVRCYNVSPRFLVKLASTEIIIYRRILTKSTLPVHRSLSNSGTGSGDSKDADGTVWAGG